MSASSSVSKAGPTGSQIRHHWTAPLLWVGIWLASIAITTGLATSVIWYLRAKSMPSQAEIDGWLWGSRDLKLSILRESYSGQRLTVLDPQQAEIEEFLKTVTKPAEAVKTFDWKQYLDVNRFRERSIRSPWSKSLNLIERRAFRVKPIDQLSIDFPNHFSRLDVVRVVPWSRVSKVAVTHRDEILVLTYAYRQHDDSEPVLFWLRKVGTDWKLVDWELVDSGMSESMSTGLWESAACDKRADNFHFAIQQLNEVDVLDYSKIADVERHLKTAEASRVPDQIADTIRYMIMSRWHLRYRHNDVQRVATQASAPDRIPGIHVLHAKACQFGTEADEGLASITHVEELIGFRPSLATQKAQLFQRLKRNDEALVEWRRLADFDPGNPTPLTALQTLLPKSERSEVIERIKKYREPSKLALEFAKANSYRLTAPMLNELAEFTRQIAPDSRESRDIEILRLSHEHQHFAAAALHRRAAEQETDREQQQRHWHSFVQEKRLAGELVSGFLEHPEPGTAFHMLVSGIDTGDSMILVEDLPPLLDAYRQKRPGDPWINFYRGYIAAERQEFAEAEKHFLATQQILDQRTKRTDHAPPDQGAEDISEIEDLESLVSKLRFQRNRARYELGEDVNILKDAGHDEDSYQYLASLAVLYHHWKALNRLNLASAQFLPKNIWRPYYEAYALLGARNFAGARLKIDALKRRESEAAWMAYYRHQLERAFAVAEFQDPSKAFVNSTDDPVGFNQISQQLLADRDWEKLDSLLEKYRNESNDPHVLQVRLESAWRRSEDASLVQLLTPWPTTQLAKQPYLESTWRERFIRSQMNLGEWDKAREMAATAYKKFQEPWPLVMIHVAQTNVAEIVRMINEDESLETAWASKDFAADPLLKPVLMDDRFAEIRKTTTFEYPVYGESESVVLLTKQPYELTESWLIERLSDHEPSSVLRPKITSISLSTFVVDWRGVRFVLNSVAEPFFSREFRAESRFVKRQDETSTEIKTMFDQQTSYLKIERLISDDLQPWNSQKITIRKFASKLMNSDVIGVVNRPTYSTVMHAIPMTEAQADQLASRRSFSELDLGSFTFRAPYQNTNLAPKLQNAIATLAETKLPEEKPIVAQVKIGSYDSRIVLPVRVYEVRYRRVGGHELIGEYTGDASFPGFPELRRGVRYIIPIENVIGLSE